MATSARIRIRDRFCSRTAPSSLQQDMLVMHGVYVDCARVFPLPRFTCASHNATWQQSHCGIARHDYRHGMCLIPRMGSRNQDR